MEKKAKICAEFELDSERKPISIRGGNRNHYKIRLFVEDVPEDTHAVTYELDESYYDPVREVRRGAQQFEEKTTSYGDYMVKANIRRKKSTDFAAETLSKALRATYGDNPSAEIRKAIEEIERY